MGLLKVRTEPNFYSKVQDNIKIFDSFRLWSGMPKKGQVAWWWRQSTLLTTSKGDSGEECCTNWSKMGIGEENLPLPFNSKTWVGVYSTRWWCGFTDGQVRCGNERATFVLAIQFIRDGKLAMLVQLHILSRFTGRIFYGRPLGPAPPI